MGIDIKDEDLHTLPQSGDDTNPINEAYRHTEHGALGNASGRTVSCRAASQSCLIARSLYGQCSTSSPLPRSAFKSSSMSDRSNLIRPRAPPCDSEATRSTKRRKLACTSPGQPRKSRCHVASLRPSPRLCCTLSRLRDVFQSMLAPARKSALMNLPPMLRSALENFMINSGKDEQASVAGIKEPRPQSISSSNGKRCGRQRLPSSGFSGVRAVTSMQYKAYMDIKILRVYTRGQRTMEAAVDNHIVLMHLRNALQVASSRNPEIWHHVDDLKHICTTILERFGTSEENLGIRAFVSLRAEELLGRDVHITSPVASLSSSLEMHSRILCASQTSWDALRKK